MSLYDEVVPQMSKMLSNVEAWIDVTIAHAKNKSFDPAVLLSSRLAPDMYPLMRQLQTVCDQPKFAAARVSGKEPPKHPDTETTFEEIRARLGNVREYLATFTPADFEGAEQRIVPLSWAPGMGLAAPDYVRQFSLPNFYFHVATAYAILRHNGVELTKMHYIGMPNLLTRD